MSTKNKYVIRSYISEKKFREIICLFSEDLSATQISHLAKIPRLGYSCLGIGSTPYLDNL
jgi:hypothetical protein